MNINQFFITQTLLTQPFCVVTYAYLLGLCTYFYPCALFLLPCIIYFIYPKQSLIHLARLISLGLLMGYGRIMLTTYNHTQAIQAFKNTPLNLNLEITVLEKTDRTYCPWLIEATICPHENTSPLLSYYTLRLYTNKKPLFDVGDIIHITNPPIATKATNESFNRYMIRNSLLTICFIPELSYTITHTPRWSFTRTINTLKNSLTNSIKSKMKRSTYKLFCSIFLGKKLSQDFYTLQTKQYHKQWGTSHYLARSGLHMMIFIMIWKFLLTTLPLPWAIQHICIILIACAYAFLSWGSISFYRALFLVILYQCATMAHRKTSPVFQVLVVTLITLIFNPLHIAFLDFQLSFGLTLGLALIHATLFQKRMSRIKTVAF